VSAGRIWCSSNRVDGANQNATNLMAGIEHHAVGRKWVVGATAEGLRRRERQPDPAVEDRDGRRVGVPHAKAQGRETPPETKVGQFAASDLRNFHESHKMLAQVAASAYGLPPSYMGYSSDNPPSAESILYALERLVLRTEKRKLWAGGAWERAGRIQWAILGEGPVVDRGDGVEVANAATPTLASKMDAAVKGVQSGIIDNEQAWIDLGYSEQTKNGLRERMARRRVQDRGDLNAVDQIPTTLPQVPNAPVLSV
jgi:hypothetical protein